MDARPISEESLARIRQLPGNEKCCDCASFETNWASVSHGTLLCLECAGKHRGLGVEVSFVRSIFMDNWSDLQIEMMSLGGNSKLQGHFKTAGMNQSTLEERYLSNTASVYRNQLRKNAKQLLRPHPSAIKIAVGGMVQTAGLSSKILSNSYDFHSLASALPTPPSFCSGSGKRTPSSAKTFTFECTFGAGPLSMTVAKNVSGSAVVSFVGEGGAADRNGLRFGDVIVSVDGVDHLQDYDRIMALIKTQPRPIRLGFVRTAAIPMVLPLSTASISSSSSSIGSAGVNLSLERSFSSSDIRTLSGDSVDSSHQLLQLQHLQQLPTSTNPNCTSSGDSSPVEKAQDGLITNTNTALKSTPRKNRLLVSSALPLHLGHSKSQGEPIAFVAGEPSSIPAAAGVSSSALALASPSASAAGNRLLSQRIPSRDDSETIIAFPSEGSELTPNSIPAPNYSYEWLGSAQYKHDVRLVFASSPLGLTLGKGHNGSAVVMGVKVGGQAYDLNVAEGDVLVGIESLWVKGYDDALAMLPRFAFPLTLVFRRGLAKAMSLTR